MAGSLGRGGWQRYPASARDTRDGHRCRSIETADDAADQIAGVKRSKIEPLSIRYRLEVCQQFRQLALGISAKFFRRFDRNADEAQRVARPTPADDRQVGRDDGGDLGISAGRLMIGEQQDRLSRARHLDGTGRNCIGDDIPAVTMAQQRAVEAHPHPVGALRNAKFAAEQCCDRRRGKAFLLGPRTTRIG